MGWCRVESGKARKRVVVASSFFAFAAIAVGAGWPQARAAAQSSSDARARLVEGNVTTCAGVGLPTDVQVGSSTNANASDTHVQGIVKTNAGTTHPGQGQELDVATGRGLVIDAVVVKGGPAYNVYTNPSVLPPAMQPDQHYIAPFNRGGNVPIISHWFVCYRLAAPPTTTAAPATTAAPPTTAAPTTTAAPSPPDTKGRERTTVASTATTSTTAPHEVTRHGTTIRPTPKVSTTTRPATTTVASTRPRPSDETTPIVATATEAHPASGASTAAFVVGCATTAILGLAVLGLRPRR
jgi:hypothetical protein